MIVKIFISVFAVAFVCLTVWLFVNAVKPEKLEAGMKMPEIIYKDSTGQSRQLKAEQGKRTIIIYFSTSCDHCSSFLAAMDRNIEKFRECRIYLLSQNKDLFKGIKNRKFRFINNMRNRCNVYTGIVDPHAFEDKYGVSGLPAIYVFDNKNILVSKLKGETKIKIIMEVSSK